MATQPSGFNTYKTSVDYNLQNWNDSDNENVEFTKRQYSELPYVTKAWEKFKIKSRTSGPIFKVFVKQLGEQFGDPIGFDFTNQTVGIIVYDGNDQPVTAGTMTVSDVKLGEVSYQFDKLDFAQPGILYANIIITDNSGNKIVLPNSNERLEIIVT